MKIVAISDTHNKHRKVILPEGDILIHAGDISSRGYSNEIFDFLKWFSEQPHEYKILISGNHDFYFDPKFNSSFSSDIIPSNVIYLNDSSISIKGINFWGSPIQPYFFNWAFNRYRGADIKQHWDLIPEDTDVLITHGPPLGYGDEVLYNNENVGCEDLLERVKIVKPKYHIFGHIHEGYGIFPTLDTTFINASILNADYVVSNKPVVFEINNKNE